MKSTIINCVLLLVFLCNIQICFAQSSSGNCKNDSTVVSFSFNNQDGDISYTESIAVYDLDSGIVISEYNSYPPGGPWSGLINSGSYYWDKTDTIYSPFGTVQEILTLTGSPSGWVNSKSITYAYTATQKIDVYAIRSWNGSSWDSLYKKVWLYNAQDLVEQTATFQMQLGVWQKINMIQCAYSGYQPVSKTFLSRTLSGNSWKNDSLFEFTYTGNLRTQALVSYWDTLNLIWQPFVQAPYQQFRDWAVSITHYTPKLVNGILMVDTLSYAIDTLDAAIYYRSVRLTNSDTIIGWFEAEIESKDSIRLNGILKIKETMIGDFFMEYNFDSTWQGLYRPVVYNYYYDSLDRVYYVENRGGLTNPSGGFEEFVFDSIGFMNYHHRNRWTMVTNSDFYDYYSYYDTAAVKIIKPMWDERPMACPNSIYQPTLIVAGGCGPYQYHWYPSDGLSSDTVLNPTITVTDSINYTVIVNDNAGHSDTLVYSIGPIFSVALSVDTSNCSGPAILTAIEYPFADYQWYNNGIAMTGETTFQLTTSLTGNYSVEIKYGDSSPYSGYVSCSSSSDTIFISNQNLIYFTQQAEICDGETFELPDGIIVDQSGNYITIIPASAGCDSSITTILTVNNIPVVSIFSTDILCFGGTSQVIVSASGGIGPYSGTGTFIQPAGTTDYIITDVTGCEVAQSVTITQPSAIIADAGNSISLCPGDSVTLGGIPSGAGGIGTLTYQWLPANDLSSATISNPNATPLVSTDYILIVTDSNACSDSSFVSISVGTNVIPVIQQIGDTLFASASGMNYEWWLNGTLLMSGNFPYIIASVSGNYQVIFYDSLGCSGTSVITQVIITDIEGQDRVDAIGVFPNPAFENVTIELPGNTTDVMCIIYDLSGRRILFYILTEKSNQISVEELAAGGYMMSLIGEGFSGYKYFIVK